MAQVVGAGGGHKRGASQRGREPNTSPNSPAFPWLPPALSSGSSPQPPSPISPHFSPSPNFPSGHLGRAGDLRAQKGCGVSGSSQICERLERGGGERLPGKRKPPGRGGIQGSSGQVGGASLPPLPQLTRSAPSCHLPVSALGNAPPYLPLGSPHPRPALPATPPPPSLQRGS